MNFFRSSFQILLITLCVSLLFSLPSKAEENNSTEIRRVSFASRADGKGIVIRLHATNPINAYSEPTVLDNNRMELVIFNASLSAGYRTDTPSDPIRDLTVQTRRGHLVFSFSLEDRVTIEPAAYPDDRSNDILIGLTVLADKRQEGETAEPVADRAPALPEVENESKEPELVQQQQTSTPPPARSIPPMQHASHIASTSDKWVLDTIAIDAGHGGHDSGAYANGIKEKDINLAVALKLGYYLEKFLKVNVVYTRTDDRFVDLQERGHIANEAGAKLFISIHANSAPYSKKVSGTETYILGLHRSDKAREVMERENNVISLEKNPEQYKDFGKDNSILQVLALSANLKLSEKLAGHIENQFEERARRHSRGVKQAGLIVLWAASMPAVLVELGYLTNRLEAGYLQSAEGQDYLASAIFRAVRDYKYEYEKGLEFSSSR